MAPLSQLTELILTTVIAMLAAANWRISWQPMWLRASISGMLFFIFTMLILRTSGMPAAPAFDADIRIAFWQQGLITVWWLAGARLVVGVLHLTLWSKRESSQAKLASDLIAGLIYITAVLAVVNFVFNLPVRALLATSGIIAIVLALALQNTLADVFAGIAVGIEHPYTVGDRIWVDGAIEGVIVQVNWRSIRVRTDANDIATIPNSLIAKSRVINRSKPSTRRADSVQVSCESSARPDLVMELLTQAAMLTPKILAEPAASTALTRIGIRSNSYDIYFSVGHTDHLGPAKSTLLKEVLRQFHYHSIRPSNPGTISTPIGPMTASTGLVETLPPDMLLTDLMLFQDLSPRQRADLAKRMTKRRLEPTSTLISQGGVQATLFIIASGVLEASRSISGHSHVVGRLGPGDYFGEIGLLTGAPNAGTIMALTRCIVFELRKEDLEPIIAAEPGLAQAFEASVRRNQAFLARDAAAAVSAPPGPPAQFLAQIRAFFKA
jgi:small-conductance mechanosensitive channel